MKSSLINSFKLLAVCVAAVSLFTGCVSAKKANQEAAAPAAPAVEEPVAEEVEVMVEAPPANDTYTVVKGDCLWCISEQPQIYDNAYQWPVIYKENKSQIKDADLIYPEQKFVIPRGLDEDAILMAEKHAKNRGGWTLVDIEASDLEYLDASN